MLYGFILFIFTIAALLLVGIILLQPSKSGGLGSAMGGSAVNAAFGHQADKLLTKVTAGLSVAFMLLALIISLIGAPTNQQIIEESIIGQKAKSNDLNVGAPIDFGTDMGTDEVPASEGTASEGDSAPASTTPESE